MELLKLTARFARRFLQSSRKTIWPWQCFLSVADRIGKMVADAEAQAEFEELRGLSVRDSKQKQRASLAARRRSKLRPASHAQLQFMADDGDQVKNET